MRLLPDASRLPLRLACLILLPLAAVWMLAAPAWAEEAAPGRDWPRAVSEVNKEAGEIKKMAAQTEVMIAEERAGLKNRLKELKRLAEAEEAEVNRLRLRFEELLDVEAEKEAALAADEAEAKNLEAAVRLSAKETGALFRRGLITPEQPDRMAVLGRLENLERFPSLEDLEGLVEALFAEMSASGQIKLSRREFVGPSGQELEGDVLRAGNFTAFYKDSDGVGLLQLGKSGENLTALAARPPWRLRRTIARYFDGRTEDLPLDLSGGAGLAQVRQDRSVGDWLLSGGVLIWPILVVALVALILIIERLISLGRLRLGSETVMNQVRDLADKGKWGECRALCEANGRSPSCQIIKAGLENLDRPKEVLESSIQEAILKQLPRLERFLPTLSVLAAIAPLLGLLGTVTGMINTFQVITIFGSGEPRLMAGGISEALVTTQVGLAVAMPIIVFHHFLERRVDKIVGDMEEKALALSSALGKG